MCSNTDYPPGEGDAGAKSLDFVKDDAQQSTCKVGCDKSGLQMARGTPARPHFPATKSTPHLLGTAWIAGMASRWGSATRIQMPAWTEMNDQEPFLAVGHACPFFGHDCAFPPFPDDDRVGDFRDGGSQLTTYIPYVLPITFHADLNLSPDPGTRTSSLPSNCLWPHNATIPAFMSSMSSNRWPWVPFVAAPSPSSSPVRTSQSRSSSSRYFIRAFCASEVLGSLS